MSDFSINKINRIFRILVRLYFNPTSYNRVDVDTTPRFWLDAHKLFSIERMGLTDKASKLKDYYKYGNRLYGGKQDFEITDLEVETILSEIQQSYPYGFNENDQSSKNKYIADVWRNDAFQGYYKRYWRNHIDEVKSPMNDESTLHDYIEFYIDEPIKSKHLKGTIPAFDGSAESPIQFKDFRNLATYQNRAYESLCDMKVVDVSINPTGTWNEDLQLWEPTAYLEETFSVDGVEQGGLTLNGTGTMYMFRFVEPWPSGENGAFIPFDFKISEDADGEHWETAEGGAFGVEWPNGYSGVVEHETVTYAVTVDTKDSSHPYDGQGSSMGFLLDGVQGQSVPFKRGSKYVFDQSDVSNDGHTLFVSSGDAQGGDEGLSQYCEVLTRKGEPGTAGAETTFRVPWDAPNDLYYSCEAHDYMGGDISINDPTDYTPADNNMVPGKALKFGYPQEDENQGIPAVERSMHHYYNSTVMNMGGFIAGRDTCSQKCPYTIPIIANYGENTTYM